jgi:hypothetical protein
VVHPLEDEALGIEDVAGGMEGHDLAPPVPDHLVAEHHALQEEVAVRGFVPVPHDILVGLDLLCDRACRQEDVLLFVREDDEMVELLNEGIEGGHAHSSR